MTIQDALERAKLLGKERAEKDRSGHTSESLRSGAVRESTFPAKVAQHFPPLGKLQFDLELCSKSHVLLTDEQVAAAGAAAAAFRMMRGRMLHRLRAEKWSCIGMTSSGPGEGKTLAILNLALSIAREKLRMVYLLDLDMRRPDLLNRCILNPVNQLSQYLAGNLAAEKVLYETSMECLVLAGNTAPAEHASELLASTRLDDLLMYIRHRSPGALILIDLPPALSTDEALVVAPRIDSVFLVVSEGVTRRDLLARTIEMLSDFRVGGIILNRSKAQLGTDYYNY